MTTDWRTRLPTGARFVWGTALLAVALCGSGRALGAAGEPGPGPLPWRTGGRVGFTVDAAAFPDSDSTTLDVYVRIPPATLIAMSRDSVGVARLRVTARLRSAFGGARSQEQTQEFAVEPPDTADAGFGKVVSLRFPVRPGDHRLLVRVEDMLSRKRGLAYAGRQVTESARVEGEVRVSPPQGERDLSDLEFVWLERAGGHASAFERGGRTLLPNPERLYGLYGSSMRAAFTGRGRSGDTRPWRWSASILDAAGRLVAERESTQAAGPWLHGGLEVDLSTEPAGRYVLELKAWQEGDAAPLLRRAPFSLAWQVESWLRNPRDVEDDVHFLLGPDEEEAFALLSPGEQERSLDDFWRERDPTPGTGENEARATFLARVAYANQRFSRPGLGKGMFSDMGRVFIRHGEPSEVVEQVIPTGDETVDLIISQLSLSEDRAIGDVNTKGPGGDSRPFELWIYEGPIGLPPDADPKVAGHLRRRRLVFLFVDDHRTGDYRLRYSTE